MKILFAVKTLNHSHGGAERVLCQIASALAEEKGYDISILTFDQPNGKSFYDLSPAVKRIDLSIGNAAAHSTFSEMLPRMKAIRKTAKREKPDIVIAFMHSMFVPAAVALIGSGTPLIASEHIVPDHYRKRRLEYAIFLCASLFMKKITVVSEKILKTYPAFLHRKMVVLPNPIDLNNSASGTGNTERKNVILNVGRLDPQKDQETLIRAFAQIAPDYPDWTLRIVGEGDLRKKLEALISSLDMGNRITLPGIIRNIETEYQSANLFVMPSRYEAFGLATAEAMSFGVPAIGFSDCPGTNEVIQNGVNGLLIEPGNRIDALASAMKVLIEHKEQREKLGNAGKQSLSRYKIDNILIEWENLLKQKS